MIQFKKRKDKNRVVLAIKGETLVESALKIQKKLLEQTGGPLVLNLDGITAVDLSFIQILLCLLQDRKKTEEVTLQISSPDNPVIRAIKTAGFGHHELFSSYID